MWGSTRVRPVGGIGDDREEGDDEGDGHHALETVADPQDDQGRDSYDGHGLQEDRVGVEAALDEARLGKQQSDQEAKGKTEDKAQEGT